jgi:hypothetical protein
MDTPVASRSALLGLLVYSLPEIPSGNIWTGHEATPAYITRYENNISSPEAYAS